MKKFVISLSFVAVLGISIISSAIVMNNTIKRVKENSENYSLSLMNKGMAQIKKGIEIEIEENLKKINIMTNFLSHYTGIESGKIIELITLDDNLNISLSTIDGNSIDESGEWKKIEINSLNESYSIDNDAVFRLIKKINPFYVESNKIDYLQASFKIAFLKNELFENGKIKIIDSYGNVIANFSDQNNDNIFYTYNDVNFDGSSFDSFYEDFKNERSNSQYISYEGKKEILSYSKIDYLNKYLLTSISYDEAVGNNTKSLNNIKNASIIALIIVVSIALIFMYAVFIINYKNNKEKNEKYRDDLSRALRLAQGASAAKTSFLNNISHDIRTPMNAIVGYTNLALDTNDQVKLNDYLSKISVASNHLLALINNILDMSRIESGKMELDLNKEDLEEILNSIIDLSTSSIKKRNISFNYEKNIVHKNIICDKLKLKQVLINVLSNSIKYTEKGFISLCVNEIKCEADYVYFEFIIEDSGIGMSEEYLKKVYEPFSRAKNSTQSGIEGTGLGLSITKKIIDVKNGDIKITSKEGIGTKVIIKFRFRNAERFKTINKEMVEYTDFKGKYILLVDDNEMNLEITTEILKKFNLKIDVARSGMEAIELERKNNYDLIFMDIQMPEMNGYETTRKIREDNLKLPIIAMTANAFDEDKRKSKEVGMEMHITKPINIDILHDVLKKILK